MRMPIHARRLRVIDENTPEYTEACYDEPMRRMEEDVDVIARREAENMRKGIISDAA